MGRHQQREQTIDEVLREEFAPAVDVAPPGNAEEAPLVEAIEAERAVRMESYVTVEMRELPLAPGRFEPFEVVKTRVIPG